MSFYNFKIYPFLDENISLRGDNNKNLIIIQNEKEKEVTETVLPKILGALDFKFPEDILLLYLADMDMVSVSKILMAHSINTMIVFGIKPSQLGLHIEVPLYQSLNWNNCQYFFADNLETIMATPALKKRLWVEMQQMLTG